MSAWRYTLVAAAIGVAAGFLLQSSFADPGDKKVNTRVFELRIYFVNAGKMDALHARFKNHTNKLLEKQGMSLMGFWTDAKEPERKLYYLVAHKSKETADAGWRAFAADPEWVAARKKSEENGALVEKVDRVWLNPTDYSFMK